MAKKKKSKLKKFGAALAAGLAGAALLGRNKGAVTADRTRDMVPMGERMVQGLNFKPSDNYTTGINNMARMTADGRSGVSQLKKGGRVGVGIAKRGFGRAMKGKK